ncbi:MAG: putative manganese transporter [Alphaproteobacteria bacterium]|nr:putative manganese transporter [Alphaproteobacteria bacterium]
MTALALFYGLKRLLGAPAGTLLERHARWRGPATTFVGALPGCGRMIVVVIPPVRGQFGFGTVPADLPALMVACACRRCRE